MKATLSCDLVKASKLHIKFLQNLHKHGVTLSEPSFESFRRYRELWLPLVFEHRKNHDHNSSDDSSNGMKLIPPSDIAWMWHCHRLAPYRYSAYVKKRFFVDWSSEVDSSDKEKIQVLDAPLPFAFQLEDNSTNETLEGDHDAANCAYTMQQFNAMFPDESFFLNDESKNFHVTDTKALPQNNNNNILMEGFDLMGSCERQATFLWQVSGEKFSDDSFLRDGVSNYLKFVNLMAQDPRPQYLVPTYQIDLMWHTHILTSVRGYHEDNIRINGLPLEHNDSLTDRSEGSTLETNFRATRELWRNVYGSEYRVPGGMYRGEPPKEFYDPSWPEKVQMGGWTPDALDGLPFAHLIGKVGASSFALAWKSIDDPESFIPAAAKSTAIGVNANPKREGYIFGSEEKGVGYYSLHTRNGYRLLRRRIELKRIDLQAYHALAGFCFITIVFIPCLMHIRKENRVKQQEYNDLIAVLDARMNASGPHADLSLPKEVEVRLKEARVVKTAGSACGSMYYTPLYFDEHGGASCGAGGGATGGGCGYV